MSAPTMKFTVVVWTTFGNERVYKLKADDTSEAAYMGVRKSLPESSWVEFDHDIDFGDAVAARLQWGKDELSMGEIVAVAVKGWSEKATEHARNHFTYQAVEMPRLP